MHEIVPEAYYDILFITSQVQKFNGDSAKDEIFIFCYLGCLLYLLRGNPISEWGYIFTSTKDGSPYSYHLDSAIESLENDGLLTNKNNFYSVTEKGSKRFALLSTLRLNQDREPYLKGACSSLLSLPIGYIREALHAEPELRRAKSLQSVRQLLDSDGPGVQDLYDQFSALTKAVGIDVDDLMIPAVVWLSCLRENAPN